MRIPLSLTREQLTQVLTTMSTTSAVYAEMVEYALAHKTVSKSKLHEGTYTKLRTQFPEYPSALIQSTRDSMVEGLKSIHTQHPAKRWAIRPNKNFSSAIRLDARTFSVRGRQLTFSAIGKRVKTLIDMNTIAWFEKRYPTLKPSNSAALSFDKKKQKVFLNLIYTGAKEESAPKTEHVIGIDRGLYNLVMTSEGYQVKGQEARRVRRKYHHLRAELQQKGTRSAKRRLKALSGKEKRFMRDTNHVISKRLAHDSTVTTYVLEDLKGIRRQRKGKKLNHWLAQWAFHQMQEFLTYKCQWNDIKVVYIDPAYTSQTCNACGRVDKKNRVKGKYLCKHCGFIAHADHNASLNIRDKYTLSSLVAGAGS